MRIQLTETEDGILMPVHAHARARRNGIAGVHDGRLKLSVTQAPEKGKANRVILRMLAKLLDLSPSQVLLVSGQVSPQKVVCVSGIALAELEQRLLRCMTSSP
jgi:uncharacterized protein (TIGR00251 family)